MEQNIRSGLILTENYSIGREHSAKNVGSGEVEVLSTPSMIAFMEDTARRCVQLKLPQGYTTVGTEICVRHFNPAPVGESLQVTAQLVQIDGRKLTFKVKAEWRGNVIGEGQHQRFIVDKARFLQKLKATRDSTRTKDSPSM
jgi:fluoroacetyl-CoA thioesterase